MGSKMIPLHLSLSDLELSKSRSFIYSVVEDQYVVNIFPIVSDINLDVTKGNLLAGGVFHCPRGFSFNACECSA